ncbi:fasciclin domain-containing protein [Chitinophaga pendula]|uniref:fasciclin domain-containing protein n=1 Tax=Chitinophaga TaxID=79328 RepID=UPI000BAF08B3|nr:MULTISPECIES: fasciclin domain-containing protein [Chitinophaga]ASZ11281.1 hypothetical protein CK934_10035 [Chitinophaga sp. MD30]UCJ05719.1 fasciclin domain-containing protein [Chitinophaga pendula]
MKRYHHYLYKLLLCLSVLTVACKHEQLEVYQENISYRPGADFLKNNYDLTFFAAAVEKAGMTEELNTRNPITILAPNNKAFRLLGIQSVEDFDKMNKDSLRQMVQYHILDRRLVDADIAKKVIDARYTTLAGGRQLFISNEYTSWTSRYYFNGAKADPMNAIISNGVVHVLNKVLRYQSGTLRDWLNKQPDYSILAAAFKKFGYWELLAQDGPFTIFAPDNAAFLAKGIDANVINRMDTAAYFGHRLFGVYIQRNRRYFISDFKVFAVNNGEFKLEEAIWGDTYYMTLGHNEDPVVKELQYVISIRTKKEYPFESVGSAVGKLPPYQDYLSDNGVVQPLTDVIVLPNQAKK